MGNKYDYYNLTPSFLKMIIDNLPSGVVSSDEKYLAQDAYNQILNNLPSEEIERVASISKAVSDKMESLPVADLIRFTSFAYENYIKGLVSNIGVRPTIFDAFRDSMTLFAADFMYSEYRDEAHRM